MMPPKSIRALALLAALVTMPAIASAQQPVPDTVVAAPVAAVAATADSARVAGPSATATAEKRVWSGPLRLRADLSARKLHMYSGDEIVRSFDIAIGTPQYPTPKGSFRVRKIIWNPAWIPPDSKWARKKTAKAPGEKGNPMKVAKIFFSEPDYYIHGTGDVESLGSAASHGCLRMAPSEVAELGRYLMEHGGEPRDDSWFQRIRNFRSQTKTIILGRPISLEVTG